jgi:hypothetical protein
MEIRNHTPFATGLTVTLDKNAAEHVVIAVKGTWSIAEGGKLTLLEKQPPPRPIDEFHGEPGKSSIRYAAELGPAKPATDVALVGHAVAPGGRARSVDVALRVGPLARRARVHGDRAWRSLLGWRFMSGPKPFERMPLTYENASGGSDATPAGERARGRDARNPVGRGYRAGGSKLKWADMPPPNLELPGKPFKKAGRGLPPPAGFGFIGRDWEPRLSYAGTYDEEWKKSRLPLLPLDFDERFHNAAHPDLVADGFLAGGEPVEVRGCTRSGRLAFALPADRPEAEARFNDERVPVPLNLETVLIDTDAMELVLVWTGDVLAHGRVPALNNFEVRRGGAPR